MLRECKQKVEKQMVSHGLLEDLAKRVQSEFHFQALTASLFTSHHTSLFIWLSACRWQSAASRTSITSFT
jgi:hypothetical protein